MSLTALVLAVAAAIMVPVDGALAAPGALAAAAVAVEARDPEARRPGAPRPATALQGTWSAVLLTGAGLAGAYPWLRPAPLATVLAALGLPVGWVGAMVVVLLALVVLGAATGAAALRRGSRRGRRRAPGRPGGAPPRPARSPPWRSCSRFPAPASSSSATARRWS